MDTNLDAELDRTSRYLRRRVPAQLVEDLAQNTALEAWIHRERRGGPGYVLGIARHEAFDALRREKREHARRSHLDPEVQGDDRCVADAHAQLGEVFEFASQRPGLATPLRWILEEHSGTSFEEIASREGLTAAAVRKRVSRLRRALAAVFASAILAVGGASFWPRQDAAETFTAAVPQSLDGTYVVVDVHSEDPRAWLLRNGRVVARGDRIEITWLGQTWSSPITRTNDGVVVEIDGASEQLGVVSSPSGTIEITSPHGSLRLQRQR
ncbi:MAG TPA: sigma factor [Polyangiaceae bacterium]